MRIGTMDSSQPLGWRKNQKNRVVELNQPDAAQSSPRDQTTSAQTPSAMASSELNNSNSSFPDPSRTVPPEGARAATPRATGGVPGAGSSGARTVQWKGKTLNMAATRPAASEASNDNAAQNSDDMAAQNAQTQNIQVLNANLATLLAGMDEMCGGLQEIYGVLHKVSERDTAGERVFNTLHAELSDYKKDFIYEHLKPVVRPLLFLYDSLEQFEEEIEPFDPIGAQPTSVERSGVMPTRLVRQNTIYFREQLTEALRVCEVTPMDDPEGVFNARFHKAVKIVPVDAAEDGKVQRVVRSGWFLNGQLLRPAEVVVGKSK